jgi:hypothetical protein
MNELNRLIDNLIKEKGGSHFDYLNLLDTIGFHESGGTFDPTTRQIGGGPGRGKYQFETGKNAGGITAARRTKQYMESQNIEIPEWLNSVTQNDELDASKLDGYQQDVLFLGNMRMHPRADFSKVWGGEESIDDFWANYHWSGRSEDRPRRLKSFKDSRARFKEAYPMLYNNPDSILKFKNGGFVDPEKEIASNSRVTSNNLAAYGGNLNQTGLRDKRLNSYGTGGSHETNPHGGVPIGLSPNGKMNTVEQGETSYKKGKGRYIFSDRLLISGKRLK